MNIDTALILCAGYGKRLNPLTLKIPKPLLKINNTTLLENTIELIKNLEIKKIKINTFYLQEEIKKFIKEKNFEIEIEVISDGDEILDTGGGILNMIKSTNEQDFLVFNPDTIWNLNYLTLINQMKNFYFSKNKETILLVVKKNLSFDKNLKGDFTLSENLLKKQKENNYIYTGCQIINRKVFSSSINKNFSILQIWNSLIKDKKLYGFRSDNEFLHVTNLEVYNNLLKGN
tara:strand:+ start:1376 stop:2068 length:693 start_codon:yes stop_codon:yes gene_type:complete